MKRLRRHLGVWSVAWLCCQVAALSAFMPPDSFRQTSEQCLAAGEGAQCPTVGADGQPCPMHQVAAPANSACSLRGVSADPAAALLNLFAQPGILIDQSETTIDQRAQVLVVPSATFAAAPIALDTPPPRS